MGTGPFSRNTHDIWIIELDANGNIQWHLLNFAHLISNFTFLTSVFRSFIFVILHFA